MAVCLGLYNLINQKQEFLLLYLIELINFIWAEVVYFGNWYRLVLSFLIFFNDGIYVVKFIKASKIVEDNFIKI